jgi:hypothetical protein
MASRDRKRQIFDHLAKSIEGTGYIKPDTATPTPAPEPVAPLPPEPTVSTAESRKRQMMSHLQQSSGNFGDFSLTDKTQQQRIKDHIKKSLG